MKNTMTKIGIIALFAAIAISFYVLNSPQKSADFFANRLSDISSIIAITFGILALRFFKLKSDPGKSVLFITIGVALWFAGDLLWTYYADMFSYADIPYLLAYPFFIAGMYYGFKNIIPVLLKNKLAMIFLASLIIVLLALFLKFRPIFINPDFSSWENFTSLSYIIGDIALMLLSIVIFVSLISGSYSAAWLVLGMGLFAMFIGDFIYYSFFKEEFLMSSHPLNLTWIISYLFFALYFVLLQMNAERNVAMIKGHVEECPFDNADNMRKGKITKTKASAAGKKKTKKRK